MEDLFSGTSNDVTMMHNPTRREVLFELPEAGIVHFACHGFSAQDPSQSGFYLKEWKASPLTVSDLTSVNSKSTKFAYLSACHTSAMRDPQLLDESITLSSAIQLSGYPSVVGSLWWVEDIHSAQVAKDVYEWMLDDAGINERHAAEGLRNAVRALRDRTRFAKRPYIHIGI